LGEGFARLKKESVVFITRGDLPRHEPRGRGAKTTITLKWSAQRLSMGTWTHLSNLLARPTATDELQ
jgi:hypothetical protein